MEELTTAHGVTLVLRALRFVARRLDHYPKADPIQSELLHYCEELTIAAGQYEMTLVERMAATAEISYRDSLADDAVHTLDREALRLLGSPTDPRYTRLFPVSSKEAMASTAGHRQQEFVQHLLTRLDTDSDLKGLSAHAGIIRKAQDKLASSLSEREACYEPERIAGLARTRALEAACSAYNRTRQRLQLLFSNPALVESCFPELPARR